MEKLEVGYRGTYPEDFPGWRTVTELPKDVAIFWADRFIQNPEKKLGFGWLNKLYIIVEVDHDKAVALYNHDGFYYVLVKRIE